MFTSASSDRVRQPHEILDPGTKTFQERRSMQSVRDNVRLAQENEQLRRANTELTTAAEMWIRLYEAALGRANAAEARLVGRSE